MASLRQASFIGLVIALLFFSLFSFASAHSTVTPSETQPSKYETFSLNVPTEKEIPTNSVRLLIPSGLDRVTPFVKPGWKINIRKDSEGRVTEVEWSGGSIPAEQKDVFLFTARTGTTTPTLIWKVYQSYSDGEVVSWDRDPKVLNSGEERVANPYSVTNILEAKSTTKEKSADSSLIFSMLALVLSIIALVRKGKSQ